MGARLSLCPFGVPAFRRGRPGPSVLQTIHPAGNPPARPRLEQAASGAVRCGRRQKARGRRAVFRARAMPCLEEAVPGRRGALLPASSSPPFAALRGPPTGPGDRWAAWSTPRRGRRPGTCRSLCSVRDPRRTRSPRRAAPGGRWRLRGSSRGRCRSPGSCRS